MLQGLKEFVREAMVLSTCNRTEVYAVSAHAGSGADALLRLLAGRAGMTVAELQPHVYVHHDGAAVRHALLVASGLDSVVLGEDQIQAQWKRSLAHARVADSLGPVLDRLGAAALSCGKRVRSFTGVGRHSVSLESLAVRAALAHANPARRASWRTLVIGAGESAAIVVRQLQAAGPGEITVMSRSPEKAAAFAEQMGRGTRMAPIDALPSALADADMVFCCTAAPHPVLGHAHFEARVSRGMVAPLVCVDLGMPRDVEDAVAAMPGVRVIAMAELASLAERHREERRGHVPAAEAIVAAETARFLEWKTARGSAASIARLQAHAQSVASLELDVALARLSHLPARDRDVIAGLARRIVNKLLHAPTVALRGHPEADNIALALEYAFGLRGAGAALESALPPTPDAPVASEPIEEIA